MRVSKADGSQSLDLQRDALVEAGVDSEAIYDDSKRPGSLHCRRRGYGEMMSIRR